MELSKKKTYWILLLIMVLGAALRLWGIDFGLPNLSRPDENHISQTVVYNIVGSFIQGKPSLDPHFFYYPSLFLYLLGIVYDVYFLLGYWIGWFPDGESFIRLYQSDWTSFHLLQRLLSAVFGIISIPAIYALAKQVTKNRFVGLISAFILSVAYLHVRDSHFGMTDIASTFWVIVCLYHVVRYAQLGKPTDLYKAAILAGLTATTKYPAGFVIVAVYAAYVLRLKLKTDSWVSAAKMAIGQPSYLMPMLFVGILFVATFFIGTPYSFLNPIEFLGHVKEQSATVNSDMFGYMLPGWRYHVQFSLWYGLGALGLIGGMAGLLWCLYRNQAFKESIPHWAIMAFCGVYYVANAHTHYVFARYSMPYVPILAMYAAIAIQAVSGFLAQKLSFKNNLPVTQACISVLLMLVLVYPSLANSVAIDQVFSNRDTRSLARDWLVAHLKPGEGLGIGMVFTHVDLPPVYKRYFLRPHSDGYDYENNHNHYIYRPNAELMSVSTNRNEFNVSTYSDEKFLRANGIKYVVLGTVTLPMYHMPEFEIEAVHNNPNLRKVISFNAFPEGQDPLPWQEYDSIDGFFVPFTKPGAIERPGPQIEIFEVLPEKSAG